MSKHTNTRTDRRTVRTQCVTVRKPTNLRQNIRQIAYNNLNIRSREQLSLTTILGLQRTILEPVRHKHAHRRPMSHDFPLTNNDELA